MATSPFDPDPDASPSRDQPQAPQGAPDTTSVAGGWRDWVSRPDNRAALMQFGIAMLQPVGIGETPLSHAAGAVGHAGEAAGRVQAQELKEQEASSKQDLRAAQAQAAEARAGAAGSRLDTSAARLELARDRLTQQGERNKTLDYIRLMNIHRAAERDYNSKRMLDPSLPEFPSFENWAAQRGFSSRPPAEVVDPRDLADVKAALAANPNDPRALKLQQIFRDRGADI